METSFDLTWLENPNKSEIPDAPLMKLEGMVRARVLDAISCW
jgi:hypothetical protein